MPEDAPKKSKPIEVYAEAEPVKLGSMLLTLVEPHRGHEVAYNRWYERDHFYAGCMVGPYNFAGRRYVATADLKALRDPDPSAITGEPGRGSYISAYWVLDGYHDVWNKWALRQVNALHAAGRMFQERDHVHTLLYFYEWEHRRDPDGVPVELALDHPYRGFVTVFIDRDESITNEELWSWLRNEHLPALMPGTDADLVAAFTPIALEVDAPGDVPREEGARQPHRPAVVLEHAARGGVGAGDRGAPAPARGGGEGQGRRHAAVHPDHPRDRHLHRQALGRLNARRGAPAPPPHPRARISTWGMTKMASSDSAQRVNASAMAASSSASLSPYSTACSAKRE